MGVTKELAPFLPTPAIEKRGDRYVMNDDRPDSIGRTHFHQGNVGVHVRAYVYMLSLGRRGLLRVAPHAVANANYLRALLKGVYETFFPTPCMHEVVFNLAGLGVDAVDLCKRLIDFGFHPPTVHFPFHHALMIEPTETESRETLESFAAALRQIRTEVGDRELFERSPTTTPVTRLDEVRATKRPVLRWTPRSAPAPSAAP